jgi:DNA-binding MarR family transcriptional regulator
MSDQPGRRLERDPDGRLYEPLLRGFAASSVEPDRLLAVEAVLALEQTAFLLKDFMRGLSNSFGGRDARMRLLSRLHRHRGGMALDRLTDGTDPEELSRLLDDLERAGLVGREADLVRLTDEGLHRMDEIFRKFADRLSTVTEGLNAEELATLRHVCLTMAMNQRQRWDEELAG